jgi:transcriptional regulator with XRE-family HTH domain
MKMPGSRIKALRQAKGWSQVKLAKLAGISQAALSELETGQSRTPSGDALLLLAKHLETDPDFIVTGRASPVSEPVNDLEEVEILKLWRELDAPHRAAVMATARALRASQAKPSKVSPFATAK